MSSTGPPVTFTIPSTPPPPGQERPIVPLETATGTAPSSGNNLPASAQKNVHLLPLYDPYGPALSLSEFRDLVRHSLAPAPETPPPPDLEAGEAPTRRLYADWGKFLLQLIRQGFSWIQMGLPSLYFSRVESIIRKSEISMVEFASITRRSTGQGLVKMTELAGGVGMPDIGKIHSMVRFEQKWEAFVMQCMEEWRNLNVINTLLLSILLTFLGIAEAGLHPFTRLTILLSLECAFMSLLYSILYVARFHGLGNVKIGMSWIFAAAKTSTPPYWNMWLFLASPTVWLAYSLIFFSTSLLSFVWTSGDRRVPDLTPSTDKDKTMDFIPMSFRAFTPLWPRIILTAVFMFGLGMGLLVMKDFRDVGAHKWEPPNPKRSSTSTSEGDAQMSGG